MSFKQIFLTITSIPSKLPYLVALRPQQWTKNLVVFAAPLFGFSNNMRSLWSGWLAFSLFCAISSSFYLLNDIVDLAADRQHPVKCHRPIASGKVSVPVALTMATMLFTTALIISWRHSFALGLTLTAYALLQIAYNFWLKKMVILDIGAIATGFVLRAVAGGAATGIILSPWLLLCTAMLALFLGVEKRKAELRLALQGGVTRHSLKQYSLALLNRMENIVTSSAVVTYALWSSGPHIKGASTPWMMLTLPFVLYGIFRYQFLSELPEHSQGNSTERPEDILLKDLPILLTVIGWAIACFAILELKHIQIIE